MTIEILHADFRDLPLDTFDCFDAMITDPPYSSHVHAKATSMGNDGRGPVARDFGFASLEPSARERACKIMTRVKRWSIVFSDFAHGADVGDVDAEAAAQAGHYVLEGDCAWRFSAVHAGAEWIRLVPWVRWSQPQITGDRPPSGAEAVLHFHRQEIGPRGGRKPVAKHWNGSGGLTHYAAKSLRGDDKHPTEKPLGLMLDLVSWYTDAGETIIDPFGGRGTTGQAARILGRDAVIIELDAAYAANAEARCTGALDVRDRTALAEWCKRTADQAEAELTEASTTDGGKRRANARLADVARATEWI